MATSNLLPHDPNRSLMQFNLVRVVIDTVPVLRSALQKELDAITFRADEIKKELRKLDRMLTATKD